MLNLGGSSQFILFRLPSTENSTHLPIGRFNSPPIIKYNIKRLKLEDLVKKYSKEAYRLSTLNKKKKATFSNPNYIKNKLNKLK